MKVDPDVIASKRELRSMKDATEARMLSPQGNGEFVRQAALLINRKESPNNPAFMTPTGEASVRAVGKQAVDLAKLRKVIDGLKAKLEEEEVALAGFSEFVFTVLHALLSPEARQTVLTERQKKLQAITLAGIDETVATSPAMKAGIDWLKFQVNDPKTVLAALAKDFNAQCMHQTGRRHVPYVPLTLHMALSVVLSSPTT